MLDIIAANADKVDGIKISLLDADTEIALRRAAAGGRAHVHRRRLQLPGADPRRRQVSDALLGIFDAIAPGGGRRAARARRRATSTRYEALLAPTVPLSRHIFAAPTPYYKTGVVFLAYLNGHQEHFRMVGGLESGRSVLHLAELFVLADQAGLLRDPRARERAHAARARRSRGSRVSRAAQLQPDDRRPLVAAPR